MNNINDVIPALLELQRLEEAAECLMTEKRKDPPERWEIERSVFQRAITARTELIARMRSEDLLYIDSGNYRINLVEKSHAEFDGDRVVWEHRTFSLYIWRKN